MTNTQKQTQRSRYGIGMILDMGLLSGPDLVSVLLMGMGRDMDVGVVLALGLSLGLCLVWV